MKPGRIALLLLPAGLLAAGIYAAALGGIADAHYYNARTILAAAAREKRMPGAAELASVQASLAAALALERTNPLFVEQRARAYEMQALHLPRADPASRALLRQALDQFRAAALMRPGSPYVWTAIAALKLRLDQLDFEFYGALERAVRYGRWEPPVQLALADAGLASWRLLAQPARRLVLDAIARALPQQGDQIRQFAVAHGTLGLICAEAPGVRAGIASLCVNK